MLDAVQLFHSELAMNALFASLAWCLAAPNRASILSTVLCATIWPFVNKPLEGHILTVLTPGHGITTSDMLSVCAVIVAAVQVGRLHSKARARRNNLSPEPLPTSSPGAYLELGSPTHPTVPFHHSAGSATSRRLKPASVAAASPAPTRPPRNHSPRRVVRNGRGVETLPHAPRPARGVPRRV